MSNVTNTFSGIGPATVVGKAEEVSSTVNYNVYRKIVYRGVHTLAMSTEQQLEFQRIKSEQKSIQQATKEVRKVEREENKERKRIAAEEKRLERIEARAQKLNNKQKK